MTTDPATTAPVPVNELTDPVVWGDDLIDIGPFTLLGAPLQVARRLIDIAHHIQQQEPQP